MSRTRERIVGVLIIVGVVLALASAIDVSWVLADLGLCAIIAAGFVWEMEDDHG